MERNEFIKSLGLGIALVCAGSCLESCGGSKDDDPTPNPPSNGGGNGGGSSGTKVTIDLSTQLLTVGSFAKVSGVLFVRLAEGNTTSSFIATQTICPHQGGGLNWVQANNLIQCDLHSSQYNSSGGVVRQPSDGGTTTPLAIYSTSITGNVLTATVS